MKSEKTLNLRFVRGYRIVGKIKSNNEEQTKKAFQFVVERIQRGASLEKAIEETKKRFGINMECETAQKEKEKPVHIIHIG